MKNIFVLIKREILIFFRNINSNLLLYFLFPILLYFFLFLPINIFLNKAHISTIGHNGIIYIYHGIPSIIFTSCVFFSFIIPLIIIKRDKHDSQYLEYTYTTGINMFHYSTYIIIYTFICVYIEFLIALFISMQLSYANSTPESDVYFLISLNQVIKFIIVIAPSILLFSTLGLFLSNFIKNNESIFIISIILFLFISFGSGSFIPIEYFSDKYSKFTQSYNFVFHLRDMFTQILKDESLGGVILKVFSISFSLSCIFYFLNIFSFTKIFKNK